MHIHKYSMLFNHHLIIRVILRNTIQEADSSSTADLIIRPIKFRYNDMKWNIWVSVNCVFFVTSEVVRQWFLRVTNLRVTKSRVKIIAVSHHGWRQYYSCWHIHYSISYKLFMSLTHSVQNKNGSFISRMSPRTVSSDLTLWRHQKWSVTSRERQMLALRRHIRRFFLHAQIGEKAIFISES